jgi:hypothetical protein
VAADKLIGAVQHLMIASDDQVGKGSLLDTAHAA